MTNFSVEIPHNDPEKMKEFNQIIEEINDALAKQWDEISTQFSISTDTAMLVAYLRTRSRWTQDKENELIRRDKEGNPVSFEAVLSGEF